jgi:C_GCAxxG_C_C family probable redox protein
MNSNECANKFLIEGDHKEMNRRKFLTKCVGCTAGLTLLASPGINTKVLAGQDDKSKEEILKELEAKVNNFMPKYKSCALTSFAALNEQFKLNADQSIPALMPFTGGIARHGETCGAVSGSLLALGYYFEPINQDDNKQFGASFKFGGLFFDGFEKEFGSTRCREVVKHQYGRTYDLLDPEEMKLFMEVSEKDPKCMEVVKKAVLIAGDLILENS